MYNKKRVMIPGPTPVIEPIRYQMGREVQAFGDPAFIKDYKELIDGLRDLYQCDGVCFPLAGTGTLAMEMAVANSTKAGDGVLIVSHGYFGDRFIEICARKMLDYDVLSSEWGQIVPVDEIRAKLHEKSYAAITVTHVDTSTGVRAPIEEIGKMMAEFPETLFILDGVAATGGEFVDMKAMNIDVMFTASQKAFGVCPGMFILWANQKSLQRRKDLGLIPEYYIDYEKWLPIMHDPAKYFATPAINLVWALKASMQIMRSEGLTARYERHERNARAIQKAFESLGFRVLANANYRAVTLSNLVYPEGVPDLPFRNAMLELGINVAGGLGPYAGKMVRVGHMGNIDESDLTVLLSGFETALRKIGYKVDYGKSVGVYLKEMESSAR
ncbi:MAG TPA: alanine--glyoxylate aminotransferase family protein [Anaerolineaceae bacterium]|nr:alanine--glyoxylate aminotransferase family protein [Anaerolineaceae bacterium]